MAADDRTLLPVVLHSLSVWAGARTALADAKLRLLLSLLLAALCDAAADPALLDDPAAAAAYSSALRRRLSRELEARSHKPLAQQDPLWKDMDLVLRAALAHRGFLEEVLGQNILPPGQSLANAQAFLAGATGSPERATSFFRVAVRRLRGQGYTNVKELRYRASEWQQDAERAAEVLVQEAADNAAAAAERAASRAAPETGGRASGAAARERRACLLYTSPSPRD
jgi:hypothetical protein